MFTIHLSAIILLIYFFFSAIALLWGVVQMSLNNNSNADNTFYSGLIMFVLGTWKGMTISSLQQLFSTCIPTDNTDTDKDTDDTPQQPPRPTLSAITGTGMCTPTMQRIDTQDLQVPQTQHKHSRRNSVIPILDV